MKPSGFIFLLSALMTGGACAAGSGKCAPGPWGDIRVSEIFLEAPESLIRLIPAPSSQTVWRFPGMDIEVVTALLNSLTDDPVLLQEMRREVPLQTFDAETRAFPSPKIIRALPVSARISLYRVLSRYEENPGHFQPVIIETNEVRSWFPEGRISAEALSLIEELSFPLGDSLAFVDLPSLLPTVRTEREEIALRKALTRTRSLLLDVQVAPGADFDQLVDYWTCSDTALSGKPLLESFRLLPERFSFNVAEVLPPLPRKHLNSFPSPGDGLTGSYPNSFWSTLNFFKISPDPRFMRKLRADSVLTADYEEVKPPLQFGDVVSFRDPARNQLLHVCTYIADDIAYTKNGKSVLTPWVFMRIKDIKNRYSIRNDSEISYLRQINRSSPVPKRNP
ncbi:MAG: hypothetical protein P1U86_02865 [Verrucomicrobiales bacterium]|nr:hypothetical protein [Verrucomicrobiales bacterium]